MRYKGLNQSHPMDSQTAADKNSIINKINTNPKHVLAPLIPHRYSTYIYLKEQIINHFEDGNKWGVNINYLIDNLYELLRPLIRKILLMIFY